MGNNLRVVFMHDTGKEKQKKSPNLLDLNLEDRRNLVDFFALLIKVDKRVNPAIYQLENQTK